MARRLAITERDDNPDVHQIQREISAKLGGDVAGSIAEQSEAFPRGKPETVFGLTRICISG